MGKVLVDLHNVYDPEEVRGTGFRCISVGRAKGNPLQASGQ